jgi:hypothetical protein
MIQLRKAYEQQLINLSSEVKAPIGDLTKLSNVDLLAAINKCLRYFKCDTLNTTERNKLALRMNGEGGKK